MPKEDLIKLNENTSKAFAPIWRKNASDNLYKVLKHKRVQDICHDKSKIALIIAAGPSLKYHFKIIRDFREEFTIFCVDVAFGILVDNDIMPDYVMTLDSGNIGRAFPERLKEKTKESALITATVSPAELTDLFKGEIYYYNCHNPQIKVLTEVEKMFPQIKPLVSRLNVADFALYNVGLLFGYKNICVMGMDFSFTDREIFYAGETSHIHHFDELSKIFKSRIDNFGEPIYITDEFQWYVDSFVDNWRVLYGRWKIFWMCKGSIPLSYDRKALIAELIMRKSERGW